MVEWMGRLSMSGSMVGCCGIEDGIAGPGARLSELESWLYHFISCVTLGK